MIDVIGFGYNEDAVAAHVHSRPGLCSSFQFQNIAYEYPALASAVQEVERCIIGAVVAQARQTATEALPESPEVDMGLCKICLEPVSMTTPGALRNGPYVYCPRHSS